VTSQVILDDGNENTITDHLRDDHRKGTRGMNDEYLSTMHRTLHQRKQEPVPDHAHPGQPREKDGAGDDRESARPGKKGSKKDNKRK
jgi:hypothetical protein